MSQHELARTHKEQIYELHDLLERSDKDRPAKGDVKALRDFLWNNPALWAYVGDLADQAAIKLIHDIRSTPTLKECFKVGYDHLNRELGGYDGTPIERLLVQQVVLSWMRLAYAEHTYQIVTTEGGTFKKMDYWERRLNASQRRFLRGCETLARIRKIDPQIIQVNIAKQQVNLAG